MSELRLILLAAGIVLLIGIYVFTRLRSRKSTARTGPRREPSFDKFVSTSDAVPASNAAPAPAPAPAPASDAVPEDLGPASISATASPGPAPFEQPDLPLPEELRPEPVPANADAASGTGGKEKVIVMHVSAKSVGRFSGPAIVDALRAENMEFGEFNIFHRRSGGQSLFHAASMVEPGQFDMENIDSFSTPGISLFLVLPGPDSPIAAFTEMLSTARRLSNNLGGEVLDESGSTLSRQAASHLREQIIDFSHRIR